MMKKIDRIAPRAALIAVVAAFVIQCVLVVLHWNTPQGSDMGEYIKIASQCVGRGSWYPSMENLNGSYLFAPGWVNFIILLIRLTGSWKFGMVLNVIMSLGITWFIYLLGRKFFSRTIGCVAVVLWSALYSNWFVVVPMGTELPFLFLALGAFTLCAYRPDSPALCFLAGAMLVTANYVRPLGIVFLAAILLFMAFNRAGALSYPALLLAVVLGIWGYGSISQRNVGIFAPQSTTGGVNLVMSANDLAYGGVATHLLADTTNICYIENERANTFVENDSIRKARAVEWIKTNPGRYAWLYVKKLGGLFIEDSWADRPILGGDGFVGNSTAGNVDRKAFIERCLHMAVGSLVYYIVLILGIIGLFRSLRTIILIKWRTWGPLVLLLLMGIGSTCLFSVSPRYHYPFMFVIVLFAAMESVRLINRKQQREPEKNSEKVKKFCNVTENS